MVRPGGSEHTDLFLGLVPERVLAAVEAAGLTTTGACYPLNSFENRVYEVELGDRSRVVAKFYRPGRWRAEQILAEHSFLAELAAAELPVCTVRPFPNGGTLEVIDGIYYSLSDRRGGRAPDELTPQLAERLGMFVGRMHVIAAAGEGTGRPQLDAERYIHQALGRIEDGGFLPQHFRRRYLAAAQQIAAHYDARALGVPLQRIHADLHLGNVLLRDGELRVLDFDDMAIGPAVQDLWLAIPGRDPESLALRQRMLAGYERFRAFDHATLALIEPLRGLRMVRYAGWLARRWHDPAFKAGWPHFGSEDYWRNETTDLEEQLAVIDDDMGSALTLAGDSSADTADATDASEMTNKDYFWDWEES